MDWLIQFLLQNWNFRFNIETTEFAVLAQFWILTQKSLWEDSGGKWEQIFHLALCHNFTKPIKSQVSSRSFYSLCTLKRFSVLWRIYAKNFPIVFGWFLPLVFTASGVYLRQDLENWAFPGSAYGEQQETEYTSNILQWLKSHSSFLRFSLVFYQSATPND